MSRNVVLIVALFVSMALNVFIIGAFVGVHLAGGKLPPGLAARARNPVAVAIRELPAEEQQAWRAGGPAFAATNGPRVREARRLTREAMASLGRDPLDPAAALAELGRARALEHDARTEMDRRIVAFAATLPPADRARFAAALSRPPVRRGPPI